MRRPPTEADQAQLAEYWFRLNFVPFEADRPWFTIGVSALDGPDAVAPEHAPAGDFLVDEFTDVLSVSTIAGIAARLEDDALKWTPAPPDISPGATADPARAARVALERVEADLARQGRGTTRDRHLTRRLPRRSAMQCSWAFTRFQLGAPERMQPVLPLPA